MSRDSHKKTAWLVIDETGSEGDDDDFAKKEEDSDSVHKLKYRPSKVAAKERDKDKVVVVDLDKPNLKANTNDKEKTTNSRTSVTRKTERGYSSKTDVKEEEKSSGTDVTFIGTSAIVIDDDDDEDIIVQTSVPQKTRKRKDSIKTVDANMVKTTEASSSKKKLAVDKFNNDEKEVSDPVVKYQPSRKTARKDKDVMNHKTSNKDKVVEGNTSTVATKVKKKEFNGKADVREEHRSLGTNEIQIIIDDDDDEADGNIKVETKVPDKNTKRKGSSVKTATKKAKIVDDDDEADGDIKMETKVPDNNTKRKGSNVKTATKNAKIVQASSSKQIFEVDESGNDKLKEDKNEDSDDVFEYQSSKKVEREDENKRSAIGFDTPNRKTRIKDAGLTSSSKIPAAEIRKKEEDGSSYTDVKLQLRSEITIDDEDDKDIKLGIKLPVKNTKRKESSVKTATKNAKIGQASSSKQIFEVDESGNDKLKEDKNEDSDDVFEYQSSKKVEKEDEDNRSAIGFDTPNRKTRIKDAGLTSSSKIPAAEIRKKEEDGSSYTDVKLQLRSQITIDDEDDKDIKLGIKLPAKNTKRKGSSVKTVTKKARIGQASSSRQIFEVDESGSDKLKEDKNEDSDDVFEYQSSKKVERKDEEKRSAIGFDKSNRKTRIKDAGLTSSSKIPPAEIRKKEEEGSSYTDVKLQLRSEITIDDEDDKDIKLGLKLPANNTKQTGSDVTPISKKPKTNEAPRAKKTLKNNEEDKTDNFSSNVDAEWSESDYLSEFNQIEPQIAANLISLFKNDNTIPFIARYRKEMTGGMEPEQLRNIKNTYDNLQAIKQRASIILKTIDKLGKWSPEIHSALAGAKTMNELELIYAPYKPGSKGSLAERAKELGLASIGKTILQGRAIPHLSSLIDTRREGLKTENDVRQGIIHIIADVIHKDKVTFEGIRKLRKIAVINIETTKSKTAKSKTSKNDYNNDLNKYEKYFNFVSSERIIKDYEILAINRGEAQKILTVKIVIPEWFQRELMTHCLAKYKFVSKVSNFHHKIIQESFNDAYTRLIKALIIRQIRHELNERAESASIEVFASNLKKLLLSPPLRGKTILGIDPGFKHGCKLAVISQSGNVLDTATIYPHTKFKSNSEQVLTHLIKKYSCTIVALGNGTACRETETFLTDLIQAGVFAPLDVSYTIVNEAGASIYSCSSDAKSEFPNLDPNIISAISIARRLQDPLAELIKVEPKHLGIGMYQLDLPKKQLQLTLDEVISETVSFVGVDINTASHCLLTKVAGLSATRATNIITLRDKLGTFTNRQELLEVKGIGNKFFVQCAGFIRILPETALIGNKMSKELDYLDQTWIHPESYDVARKFLKACKCDLNQLGSDSFIQKVSSYANGNYKILADKFGTSEQSMEIIVKGLLMKKGEDIRVDEEAPLFRRNLRCIDDLCVNTILTGSVRNVTNFGTFVDIGVGTNGLISSGKMNGQTLSLGQKVEVVVLKIDKHRGRITLSL